MVMGRPFHVFHATKNAIAMKPVVMKLTDEDIVNLAAYVASLQP